MKEEIIKQLDDLGFVVAAHKNYDEYLGFINILGVTAHIEEIKYCNDPKVILQTSKAMPLHTDHPNIDIISWYCHENAEEGGESILIDTRAVFKSLPGETLRTLGTINVKVPACSGEVVDDVICLISDAGVYFANWLIQESLTIEQNSALNCFKETINRSNRVCLKIPKGGSLSINNKRMLHGRAKFSELGNARHLSRHWIKKYST